MIDEAAGEFTILGVPIETGSFTRFELDDHGLLSEAEFYDRVTPGSVVQAKDREDGDETEFDRADEIELEEPELEDLDDEDADDGEDFDPDEDDEDDEIEDDGADDD